MPRARWQAGLVGALLAVCLGLGFFWRWPRASTASRLLEAQAAISRNDHQEAARLAQAALVESPDSVPALLLLGRCAAAQSDWESALDYYDRLPDANSASVVSGHAEAARIALFELHRASDADRRFQKVLSLDPANADGLIARVGLLAITGRAEEAQPLIEELIRQNRFSIDHLLLLQDPWTGTENPQLLALCQANRPDDPLVLLGLGWLAQEQHRSTEAEALLRRALQADPQLLEVHIRLGEVVSDQAADRAFLEWNQSLPDTAAASGRIWYLRGRWAERRLETQPAVRMYWEALRRDPRLRDAAYRLGQLLAANQEPADAEVFLEHARLIEEIKPAHALLEFNQSGDSTPIRQMVLRLITLGRTYEALGWCRMMQRNALSDPWWSATERDLVSRLTDFAPRAPVNPALQIDLSAEPLIDWAKDDFRRPRESEADSQPCRISFTESGPAVNLRFSWHHTGRPHAGLRMFEFTGGGVGVVDFDADLCPDLLFTQGTDEPLRSDSQLVDRLFRNRGGEHFSDVTDSAGLAEDRFSQGVAVADFDGDGFADLYIGNIGLNRLYHNQGDGSFSEVALPSEADPRRWTSSCCLADLSGDGLPELYDVNYLSGEDLFQRICRDAQGHLRLCMPDFFSAAEDQVLLNCGDGAFKEVTSEFGFGQPGGKGLGVVVADFTGRLAPEVFIANDAVPNFFFERIDEQGRGAIRFREIGLLSGLAYDGSGRAEGCMGIAVGDVNEDALLDLFVTNFYLETNTLYLQRPGRHFEDATEIAGLSAASRFMLGFGTQCLDADLDGCLDLIVANGHVDDLQDSGVPYAMRAQFFHNTGGGNFVERPSDGLGAYFERPVLGRGLARLDWNGDGLEDVAVTHLDAPAALLTNTTPDAGHYLALALRGRLDRDATGATVTVQFGSRTLMRQLTAGDGYQACNQRLLLFGLASATSVEQLRVKWPSGREQVFSHLAADECYMLYEDRAHPWRLPACRKPISP